MATAYTPGRWLKRSKRPYLLLEVLIAFALVVMCLIPLLQPHWTINRIERELQRDYQTERSFHVAYLHLLEQLYLNAIAWEQVVSPDQKPFSEPFASQLEQQGFTGRWKTEVKARKGEVVTQYSLAATIELQPLDSEEAQQQVYRIFVTRDLSDRLGVDGA